MALGIGDDGAVINPEPDTQLVVATDTLVESVHFPADASAQQIATRALCVNLSDMAAMGAKPKWFTLALTIPPDKANAQSQRRVIEPASAKGLLSWGYWPK